MEVSGNKERRSRWLYYCVGILILLLYHMQYDLSYGDSVNFYGNVLKRGSEFFPVNGNVFEAIYNFTSFHYLNWSSRNVIELILIIVGSLPVIFWHILDILSVVLIAYSLDGLVHIKDWKKKYFCIFSFMMMYQVVTMRSAGWVATTINYSWVVAAGLYMFYIIQRIRKGEAVSKISYILALVAAVFAFNQEQLNGMFLLFMGMILINDFVKKSLKKTVLPFYLINIIEFFIIFFCPGNANRKKVEVSAYFPIYEDYSLIHKVYEGICAMLKALFDVRGMAIITMTGVVILIYLSFKNKRAVYIKTIGIICFIYQIAEFIYSIGLPAKLGISVGILNSYRDNVPAAVVGIVVTAGIAVLGYANIGKDEDKWIVLGALVSAAATKLVLGFTVAFLVSGERTTIFLAVTIILILLHFIEKYEEKISLLDQKWFQIVGIGANVLLFAWNYYSICNGVII